MMALSLGMKQEFVAVRKSLCCVGCLLYGHGSEGPVIRYQSEGGDHHQR